MTKFEEKKKEAYEKASMKSYGNIDGSKPMRHLLNELENAGLLKEQQALPVVPDFIGKLINTFGAPEDGMYINYAASYPENKKELEWIDNHQKTWLTALLVGFTVEKPQLFYLENKITGMYLSSDGKEFYEHHKIHAFKFTQSEIDSMETGSYEQIEVEK
jgi:hypothetical protein